MSISDTSRFQLRYAKETVWDEVPNIPFQDIRVTGEDISFAATTIVSNEIDATRNISDLVLTEGISQGGFTFEVRKQALDDHLEAALFSPGWSPDFNISSTDIAADDTTDEFTSATLDFIAAGIQVGQFVKVGGFIDPANNGYFKVLTVGITKIGVDTTLVTEAVGASITINGSMIRNETTLHSFVVEKEFVDVSQVLLHSGMRVSTMNMDMGTGAIVNGSVGYMGAEHQTAGTSFSTGTPLPSVVGDLMNGVSNLSDVRLDGVPIGPGIFFQNVNWNIDNTLRAQQAIGSVSPVGIGSGRFVCNLTINAYFSDLLFYNKFLNNESSSLSYRITDSGGAGYVFSFNNFKFSNATINASGPDADVVIPLTAQAILDPASAATMQIDRFA